MTEPTDECAHPTCHCPAEFDGEYCSDFCRYAANLPDATCHCGHEECDLAGHEAHHLA
jgi:hypothetical protein